MPFTAFSFDDSVGRTEPGRPRVPEGYYLMDFEGFEPTPEDYEKTTGIYGKFIIVSGPDANPGVGVGGRMRDFNAVGKPDAQFGLGQTLGALGHADIAKALASNKMVISTWQQLSNLCANMSQRVGRVRVVALIADQPGQTRPFSGIESLHPASEWDNYKRAAVVGAATVAQPTINGAPRAGNPVPQQTVDDLFADLDAKL